MALMASIRRRIKATMEARLQERKELEVVMVEMEEMVEMEGIMAPDKEVIMVLEMATGVVAV